MKGPRWQPGVSPWGEVDERSTLLYNWFINTLDLKLVSLIACFLFDILLVYHLALYFFGREMECEV